MPSNQNKLFLYALRGLAKLRFTIDKIPSIEDEPDAVTLKLLENYRSTLATSEIRQKYLQNPQPYFMQFLTACMNQTKSLKVGDCLGLSACLLEILNNEVLDNNYLTLLCRTNYFEHSVVAIRENTATKAAGLQLSDIIIDPLFGYIGTYQDYQSQFFTLKNKLHPALKPYFEPVFKPGIQTGLKINAECSISIGAPGRASSSSVVIEELKEKTVGITLLEKETHLKWRIFKDSEHYVFAYTDDLTHGYQTMFGN